MATVKKQRRTIGDTNEDVSQSQAKTMDGIKTDSDETHKKNEAIQLTPQEKKIKEQVSFKNAHFSWAIPLQEHIDLEHGGNATQFAKAIGWSQQQINRWLYEETYWINGEIYLRVTRREPPNWKKTNPGVDFRTTQFRNLNPDFKFSRERRASIPFREYLDINYDGKAWLFAEAYEHLNLKKQQVTRYMHYKSVWVYDSDGLSGDLFRAITLEAPATKKLRMLENKKRPKAKELEESGSLRKDLTENELKKERDILNRRVAEIERKERAAAARKNR